MSSKMHGRVAVVTGGALGIGASTTRLFHEEGAHVVIADVNEVAGRALAAELPGAEFRYMDVTLEQQVADAVDFAVNRFGKLDCFINNAGVIGAVGSISQTELSHWRRTFAILLDGVFFGMKYAARAMLKRRSGCILSTVSTAGLVGGLSAHAYTSAKHAVVGMTKSVASEMAPHGIRVNAVAPGFTVTDLAVRFFNSEEEATRASAQDSPLGQTIQARDIAEGFLYLASDRGRNITGQILVIDGGFIGTTAPGYGNKLFHTAEPTFIGAR